MVLVEEIMVHEEQPGSRGGGHGARRAAMVPVEELTLRAA